jgi:cytoskeletal protein RodZ
MLIAILVLLGIAGAVWYFARKQTHTVSLTAEQTAELNRRIERDAASASALAAAESEPTSSISSPSVEQIDAVLAAAPVVEVPVSLDESAFTTPEVAAEKAAIQFLQDELAKAKEAAAAEIKSAPVETPVVEPKPIKKKRRYYPKKK